VVGSGVSGTSDKDTSVSQQTSYDYRVVALGTAGKGAYSATQTVTTPQAPPGQVSGVSAAAMSPTDVKLSWNSMSNANSYEVERSSTSASSGFSALATSLTSPTYSDTSAAPGTTYWYEVLAGNGGGMGTPSSAAMAATPGYYPSLLSNTFEGQTNKAALTTTSSGGSAGNALNQTTCTSGSEVYTTASAAHGQASALLSPTTSLCYLGWNGKSIAPTSQAYGRVYLNLSADPSAAIALLKVGDASAVRDAQVNLTKAGDLTMINAGGTTALTFTKPIPLNTWVRLEWHVVSAASGTFELRMYSGDSTTPIESEIVNGLNTGTTIGSLQVGMLSSLSAPLGATIGVDSLSYGTAGWMGPASS
jgi:hypothetical protein